MTSEVALQAIKRRKMGFNVDFLDDSGYPMDGVELDSSSSATTANNRDQQPEQASPHQNNNNITTSSSTISSNQQGRRLLQQSNNIASTTNNSAPTNSSENQQQGQQSQSQPKPEPQPQPQPQQQQPRQEKTTPANDEQEGDAPIDVMTMNEAMTTDDSPPATASHNNDEPKFSLNSDTPFGTGNASAATAISSLFRMGNQATASTPNQNSNHSATNNNGSSSVGDGHSLPKLRSFGDLFDDDDLD